MTREEAKKMLKAKLECLKRETSGTDIDCNCKNCDECNLCYEQGNMREQKEALDMAINTLEQVPCDDAVSRSEALKKFTYNHKGERIPDYDCDNFPVQIDIKTVKEILRDLPSVTPQPKTGHWIDDDGDNAICGCCNRLNHLYGTYCKHCGAKMQEVEE